MENAVGISLRANAFEKIMSLSVLLPAENTGFCSLS